MKKFTLILLPLCIQYCFAQVDIIGHFSNPSYYLGWNALSADPLNIRHDANLPINFFTNGTQRMNLTSGTGILGETNITKVNISYGGTQPTNAANVAMLNIGFTPPFGGQRSWMQVGTFSCLNTDNMYVGMKNESGCISPNNVPPCDRADAVINWGDNNITDPTFGPDNLRFIFTANISAR